MNSFPFPLHGFLLQKRWYEELSKHVKSFFEVTFLNTEEEVGRFIIGSSIITASTFLNECILKTNANIFNSYNKYSITFKCNWLTFIKLSKAFSLGYFSEPINTMCSKKCIKPCISRGFSRWPTPTHKEAAGCW